MFGDYGPIASRQQHRASMTTGWKERARLLVRCCQDPGNTMTIEPSPAMNRNLGGKLCMCDTSSPVGIASVSSCLPAAKCHEKSRLYVVTTCYAGHSQGGSQTTNNNKN